MSQYNKSKRGWNGESGEPGYRTFSTDVRLKTISKIAPHGQMHEVEAFQDAILRQGAFKGYVYTGGKPTRSWSDQGAVLASEIKTPPMGRDYGTSLFTSVRATSTKLSKAKTRLFSITNSSITIGRKFFASATKGKGTGNSPSVDDEQENKEQDEKTSDKDVLIAKLKKQLERAKSENENYFEEMSEVHEEPEESALLEARDRVTQFAGERARVLQELFNRYSLTFYTILVPELGDMPKKLLSANHVAFGAGFRANEVLQAYFVTRGKNALMPMIDKFLRLSQGNKTYTDYVHEFRECLNYFDDVGKGNPGVEVVARRFVDGLSPSFRKLKDDFEAEMRTMEPDLQDLMDRASYKDTLARQREQLAQTESGYHAEVPQQVSLHEKMDQLADAMAHMMEKETKGRGGEARKTGATRTWGFGKTTSPSSRGIKPTTDPGTN